MTTTLPMPPPPRLRLRAIHPLLDEDGSCPFVYDLERTLIFEVPPDLRDIMDLAVEAGRADEVVGGWLRERDLLTYSPRVSWGEGTTPTLPRVSDVSLDMSGTCNIGRVYCFENDIGSRIGPKNDETATAAVDFAFTQAAGAPRLSLHFGSGEPLIRFDLPQRIVAAASRRAAQSGQQIGFELTTNATLVTGEIVAFLRDHPFNVRPSCDGPAIIHDQYRPMRTGHPSYTKVEHGLRLLLEHLPGRVTVNTVISEGIRLRDVWARGRKDWVCATITSSR